MGPRSRDVKELATGADGRVEPDVLARPVDDERRLVDLLAAGEQPHHLLEGFILDVVAHDDGETADDRTRKMASAEGGVYTVVTDRGVRLVVSHGTSAECEDLDFEELTDVVMHERGGDRRIRLSLESTAFDVYPRNGAADCEAAVAFLTDRLGRGAGGDDAGPIDQLERLADLRDREAITQAEFEAMKRDLLDGR